PTRRRPASPTRRSSDLQDDPAAARVEERNRGRLVAARPLVGVIAYERGLGNGCVHAPVDPGKPGGDLVHCPVQIVDAPLERDREDRKSTRLNSSHEWIS